MTIDPDAIAAALIQMHDGSECRCVAAGDEPAENSGEAWRKRDDRPDSNRAGLDIARVWIGLPWLSLECSRRWVGDRLFFLPKAVPDVRRIAVACSRLPQRLDLASWWFDLLRTAVLQCDSRREALVAANSTAACASVSRAARLFGRTVIRFELSPGSSIDSQGGVRHWLEQCCDRLAAGRADRASNIELEILVSPETRFGDSPSTDPALSSIPLGDRLLFAAANRIQVLSCRARGNMEKLIRAHLQDEERREIPVWIASNAAGEMPAFAADMPAGCVPWLFGPRQQDTGPDVSPSRRNLNKYQAANSRTQRPFGGSSSPVSNPDEWLLHWTRTPRGPWPGESEADFLDALILQSEAADHSVLATLLKIIADGKLLGSSEGIRGGYSVVAFTAVPLAQFRSRRVFRKHRNRYDFEPWGVAIQKEQLQKIGVRPVIYGNDNDWRQLEPEDLAFFQKATRNGATSNVEELEHRSFGSVDLRQFPNDAVCIFTGDRDAAQLVSRHCDWPVIVVPGSPG